VRDIVGIPVQNETELLDIAPEGDLLALRIAAPEGERVLYARKIVLATGQESTGRWWMPEFIEALPASMRAHTCEDIDFERLAGKVVAVLGAGASAFDNAATALEHGAREVHLLCRRFEPQVVQPYRWLTFAGFLRNLSDLDDVWRWRFMSKIMGMREGFPQETYDRCAKHPNFQLHVGAECRGAMVIDATLRLDTAKGPFAADYVICGTGIENDFAARPELQRFADNILTWNDRYDPPADERDERLGRFPYLGQDHAFLEREPGKTPWIKDIHLFSIASTMRFGPSGSSINAMTIAVPKVVSGITKGLFEADLEKHWQSLRDYDVPQAVLR
jgi:cation diffusion facilitator CzcD-associated flavoprotein CzcO